MSFESVICILGGSQKLVCPRSGLEYCLGYKRAALLSRAFLLDVIGATVRVPRCNLYLAFWPPEAQGEFENLLFLFQKEERNSKIASRAREFALVSTSGKDMGKRITTLSSRFFDNGARRLLFACPDNPLIEPLILKAALELLDRNDIVIGPTFDGRYYLLGMSRPIPCLFEGIDWETDGLYKRITERLNAENIDWQELELAYEVARPEELEQLYFDIDNHRLAGKDDIGCHTERCLMNLKK